MIGGGISAHEADVRSTSPAISKVENFIRYSQMMQRAYRKELENFDRERVLSAWQALVKTQQAAMEKRAVPAMFVTTAKVDMQVSTDFERSVPREIDAHFVASKESSFRFGRYDERLVAYTTHTLCLPLPVRVRPCQQPQTLPVGYPPRGG